MDVAMLTFLLGMCLLLCPLFMFQWILPLPRKKDSMCGGLLSAWVILGIASACL